MKLKLGLIVNPYAGIGGSVGLKGSDGKDIKAQALASGGVLRAAKRLKRTLGILAAVKNDIEFLAWKGDMGAAVLAQKNISCQLLGAPLEAESTAEDTKRAAAAMRDARVDLIVFVGGDGTARDIFNSIGKTCPVLGIPSGVKMHSGVFAVSPEAAGLLILRLVDRGLVNLAHREIRDIDEQALRKGQLGSHYYGEFEVPEEGGFLQHVKSAGRESESLVVQDIAATVLEKMQEGSLYLMGPGSTVAGVMDQLGLHNTLLGVDAVVDKELVGSDLTERQILKLVELYPQAVTIMLGVIRGQGYFLGRGNQQFSPTVLRVVGLDNLWVLASKSKITGLEGRPLLVDTNDPDLDQELVGYRKVITGYDDVIFYPVGHAVD